MKKFGGPNKIRQKCRFKQCLQRASVSWKRWYKCVCILTLHCEGMNSIQIWTAHEDDDGNYHSLGGVHTGPPITPEAKRGSDRRAGMNTTEGMIISTTIRLQSSPYFFLYTSSFSLIHEAVRYVLLI